MPSPVSVCCIAGTWPRTATVTPRGASPARWIAARLRARHGPDRACDVAGDRDHPLLVVAVIFADGRAITDFRHITDQGAVLAFRCSGRDVSRSSIEAMRDCGISTCT